MQIDWGNLKTAIERHYIEAFLEQHASDIQGRVLEMGDPTYTVKFGGSRVTQADVLTTSRAIHGRPWSPT